MESRPVSLLFLFYQVVKELYFLDNSYFRILTNPGFTRLNKQKLIRKRLIEGLKCEAELE
jgi:hypothetical protein